MLGPVTLIGSVAVSAAIVPDYLSAAVLAVVSSAPTYSMELTADAPTSSLSSGLNSSTAMSSGALKLAVLQSERIRK